MRRLMELRKECRHLLENQRMPTLRNEEYRFTDVSRLLRTNAQACLYLNPKFSLDLHIFE